MDPEGIGASPPARAGSNATGGKCNEILLSFITFFLIAFGVLVFLGGKRYREEYAASTQGWRVGTTRVIELTLLREDKANLACASKHTIAGLRCGFDENQGPIASLSAESAEMLQPYVTSAGELLLGAGLWTSPDTKQDLPSKRFSVVCNYGIKGVLKSARIRFEQNGAFNPLDKTVTVGTLSECLVAR